MCNVFRSCEFFLVISCVNKRKEISESLSDKLRAKPKLKGNTFCVLIFY